MESGGPIHQASLVVSRMGKVIDNKNGGEEHKNIWVIRIKKKRRPEYT